MEENQSAAPTVMSVSMKYGAIMAAVGIAIFVVRIAMGTNPFDSDWTSWIGVVIDIVVIVLAHNAFKDGGDGYMTYGQGFGIGTLSMLIGGAIGLLFTLLYVNFIDTGIMDAFYTLQEEKMRESGQNEDAIAMGMEWTKKLFWVFYIIGIGFFSVLCGLIVSIFTQKKRPEAI